MKKYLCLLLFILLFIPISVFAKDDPIEISNLEFIELSGYTEELSEAEIVDNQVKLNLKLNDVGDSISYKIVLKNNSKGDFIADSSFISPENPYIQYTLESDDASYILKPGVEKEFVLNAVYQNKVEKAKFKAGKYQLNQNAIFNISPESLINPKTGNIFFYILFTCILISALMFLPKKKKVYVIIGLFVVPFLVHAEEVYHLTIDSDVTFKYVVPNPCTYDGELVEGVEYVNGQYTYHYKEESTGSNWTGFSWDGWGVRISDTSSTDPVTTTMCTSINDKPIVSMQGMFSNSKTTSIDTSSIDTSQVKIMTGMFNNATSLEEIDVTNFDTSQVIQSTYMFASCTGLTEIDVSNFDTSLNAHLGYMFAGCTSLTELDLSGFETRHFTGSSAIGSLASGCTNLRNVNLSNWDFSSYMYSSPLQSMSLTNGRVLSINLSNAILPSDCSYFFGNLYYIEEIILDNVDVSNVTNMNYMFYQTSIGAEGDAVIDISNFKDLQNVTSITGMFSKCGMHAQKITIDASNLSFENVTSMNYMFQDIGQSAQELILNADNLSFDTSTSIDRILEGVGKNASKVTLNISNWNFPNVTTISYSFDSIAASAGTLKMIANNWYFGELTSTYYMFNFLGKEVTSFEVELKNWSLPKVTTMNNMFRDSCYNCSDHRTTTFSLDVSGWDFPSVTDMSNMFYYAFRQVDNVNIIGISDWDTSGVTNMYGMFYSAFNMCGTVNIDLSSWDVSNVENFGYMFVYSANQVQDLSYGDFSSWNIKSGANVSGMYSGIYLTNYAPIDIGSINIPASANINSIFEYSNINASVNLKGNPSDYRYAFSSTSTHEGGEVIVNYTSSVIDIDAIIATKSNESNVTKGELITT